MSDEAVSELHRLGAALRETPVGADRDPLYRALLKLSLGVPLVATGSAGPSLKLEGAEGPTRLVDSHALGGPVVALYASPELLAERARLQGLWPDGVERAHVFEPGVAFVRLKSGPGAIIVCPDCELQLDAGEVAALGDKQTPTDLYQQLRTLITGGRGREAAKKLAPRMLYVLGHPSGGMVMFQKELPVFLHVGQATDFAARMEAQFGRRPDHALVAAGELFKNAFRGKLHVVITPGRLALKLRPLDLR